METERGLISKAISLLSSLVRPPLDCPLLIALQNSIILSLYWENVSGFLLLILRGATVLIEFCSLSLLHVLYIEPLVLWS